MMITPTNVILFGESGSGKSSIVNMLSTDDPAPISNGVNGCTLESTRYQVDILGRRMTLWDTAGLDEGEAGRVVDLKAITNLYKLLRGVKGGINLLVFVTRPRIKETSLKNWKLFHEIICQKQVPTVIVVTGLEEEADKEGWWVKNKAKLHDYKIYPDDYACITASKGRERNGVFVYEEEYEESRERVRNLLRWKCRQKSWKVPRAEWFKTIIETTYETRFFGICPPKKVVTKTTVQGNEFRKLVKDCGMSEEEADTLAKKMEGID